MKKLLFCLGLLFISFIQNPAQAGRFGLQTGLYNDKVYSPLGSSREFGMRLGFYADKTANDIIYAGAAMNHGMGMSVAGNCCDSGNCGCVESTFEVPPPMPVPAQVMSVPMVSNNCCCDNCVPIQSMPGYLVPNTCSVGRCGRTMAMPQPVVMQQPKTEIYLLTMPEQRQPELIPQPFMPPAPPVEYRQTVRGLW